MAVVLKNDHEDILDEGHLEIRKMVLAGMEQVKSGNTKDFNGVCDRLEKKYKRCSVTQ